MKEIYNFYNRNADGSVKLRLMEDGRYLMETANINYFTEHNHEGTGDVKELYAVDPDGGPMLSIGCCINNLLATGCSEPIPITIEKIESVSGLGYVFTLMNNMSFEEFRKDVIDSAKKIQKENPHLRYGQTVFNYIEEKYGVARYVQFSDGIDCFYDDKKVDIFIESSWNWLIMIQKRRE